MQIMNDVVGLLGPLTEKLPPTTGDNHTLFVVDGGIQLRLARPLQNWNIKLTDMNKSATQLANEIIDGVLANEAELASNAVDDEPVVLMPV